MQVVHIVIDIKKKLARKVKAFRLYNLTVDPNEMNNLAYKAGYNEELAKMKKILSGDIEKMGRPFGEFSLAENAVLPGQVKNEINIVKQLKVSGKKVIVPDHLKSKKLQEQ